MCDNIIIFIAPVSDTFLWMCLVTPGFLPVHTHHVANDYSLSVQFIIFWKALASSKLFIAYRSYVYSVVLAHPPISVLRSSPGFPIYIQACMRGCLNFSAQWHCWQLSSIFVLMCGYFFEICKNNKYNKGISGRGGYCARASSFESLQGERMYG
jgi:hypothetical protein